MSMRKKSLAEIVRALRLARGLSCEKLGSLSGVTGQAIRTVEAGKNTTLSTLDGIAAALGVSVSDLIGGRRERKRA